MCAEHEQRIADLEHERDVAVAALEGVEAMATHALDEARRSSGSGPAVSPAAPR